MFDHWGVFSIEMSYWLFPDRCRKKACATGLNALLVLKQGVNADIFVRVRAILKYEEKSHKPLADYADFTDKCVKKF
jgi:hypothetical protein